jgi:hypothetical protein
LDLQLESAPGFKPLRFHMHTCTAYSEAAEAAAADGMDEITSLRAKLSNAFALIRSYQKKIRAGAQTAHTPGGGDTTNNDDAANDAALSAATRAGRVNPEQQRESTSSPGPDVGVYKCVLLELQRFLLAVQVDFSLP